jgi:hypothetical protein
MELTQLSTVPKIILTPGRYPGLPLANWWARKWSGALELSSTVLSFNGFVSVQVSQNQAAVIADPANQIFVLKSESRSLVRRTKSSPS